MYKDFTKKKIKLKKKFKKNIQILKKRFLCHESAKAV